MSIDLNRLIARHQDRLDIGIASDAEIVRVIVDKIDDAPVSEIDAWHIIALRDRSGDEGADVSLRYLGFAHRGPWITSDVLSISRDLSAIQTRTKVYTLLDPAPGEMIHPRLVGLVKQALVRWGFDEALDLGVSDRDTTRME
ncbi:hypothetical protein VY88_33040 [Azospirillum thiophilum]|uniref:Uncharacterized protein n=1 Tax=Azospirillum thiophilum TaxID=528244 RepID=A0AAC8ZWU4_9PROT|nr:hypothetical protein [Azospirillum thiophilum]ALG75712.1 hypothetical protein AL072_32735 [Azospirillum thiophilum]KJR61226.1 hypothetical protein VY88_33040 [Azospirillum thiophilum]